MKKILVVLIVASLTTVDLISQISASKVKEVLLEKSRNLNLEDANLGNLLITDNYTSKGIHHVYFKQQFDGIEIYDSYAALHGKSDSYIFQSDQLNRGLSSARLVRSDVLSFEQVLSKVAITKNYSSNFTIKIDKSPEGRNEKAKYLVPEISNSSISTRLVYIETAKNVFKLARVLTIDERTSLDYWEILVDAATSEILRELNYTLYCEFGDSPEDHKTHIHRHNDIPTSANLENFYAPNQYRVYPYPIESPLHGIQSDVTEPWLAGTASPNGWHQVGTTNYTSSKGNNVDTYLDNDNTNSPTGGDAARVDGGANLEFLYTHDEALPVASETNRFAALTNLFYWNNLVHDMWSNYGFDEASGNFQEENYGTQGAGNDFVRAEAQDGSGTCNANMSTPADGGNPRMQMYLCGARDGDFDNGVVVHEYGHGISNRLTGGPSLAGCLNNQEQMGEGWSDFLGIVMTIEAGDAGSDLRPIGNYLFEQDINGGGIRTYPYTTDMAANPFTYDDIKTQSVPHGVGSVWATMLWDMTWALIEEYGFDSDFYNGSGGNNLAMQLVIEGMKIQPCNPGFVDGRDAILAADLLITDGVNQCLIWEVFANRGLGFSASQGSSGSRSDGVEAFDMPPICSVSLEKTADRLEVEPGQNIIYTLTATNNKAETVNNIVVTDDLPQFTSFVSASNGGQLTGNVVTFPAFTLTTGQTMSMTLEVMVDNNLSPSVPDFIDDLESGTSNWLLNSSGSTSFSLSSAQASSPVNSWFAPDEPSTGVANLTTANNLFIGPATELMFNHNYDTEVTWDGGVVEISMDNGSTWIDLGANFISNGYNSTINNSRPAFSGSSNGFITSVVDLSPYAGAVATIRFQMNCDVTIGGVGWYIDDIIVTDQVLSIPNIALLDDEGSSRKGILLNPTVVVEDASILSITTGKTDPTCNGTNDGIAYVVATSGTGNYSYLWSTGGTNDTIGNISAGLYSVTVDDGLTTKVAQVNIVNPLPILIQMSSTDAIGGTGGTASANPSNGAEPYSYLWDNNETTSSISNLSAGSYYVTVTDDDLCIATDSVDVVDPTICSSNLIQIDIQMDNWPGDISLIVRDGSNNIVFEKGPYQGIPSNSLVTEYICVVDDCYTIEIDDSFGDGLCSGSQSGFYNVRDFTTSEILLSGCDIGSGVILDLCYPLLTHIIAKTNPSCTGLSDGSVDLTLNGGNSGVSILYSNGATTQDISNLASGEYTVEITDGVRTINDTIFIDPSSALVYKTVGDQHGTLKFAVEQTCPTDTIYFAESIMNQLIMVDQVIVMGNNQVIKGFGNSLSIISGMNNVQLFEVPLNTEATLMDLKLIDSQASSNGGAILNRGMLNLHNVSFENNKEGSVAKSLTNAGKLIITGTTTILE